MIKTKKGPKNPTEVKEVKTRVSERKVRRV